MKAVTHWVRSLVGIVILSASLSAWGQSERGALDLVVLDSSGTPIEAKGEIRGAGGQVAQPVRTGPDGRFSANHLVFGSYTLTLHRDGFAPATRSIHIGSSLPLHLSVQLTVAPLVQSVDVAASAPLLDPQQPGASIVLGRSQLAAKLTPQPGRELLDVIADTPGWVFEANGVLHPRGSEYETQFVVNGVPHTENLSPSFAPPIPASTVESAQVRTAGIPAEYGRSLGGVIDITTGAGAPRGWHGELAGSGGSFTSVGGSGRVSFATPRQQLLLTGEGFGTDRYLDPPVLQNFTNHGTAQNERIDEQVTLSDRDQLQIDFSHAKLDASVPNESIQQQAGQRQFRGSRQDSGSISLQRMVSPDLLLTAAGSVLDSAASLSSNPEATPVLVDQDRGFRQSWLHLDAAGHAGHHDWKIGADAILRHVREALDYTITDPAFFDPDTQPQLQFAQKQWDAEPAAFVQDTMHFGNWNVAAGLRFDDYSFLLHRHAWSPRLSVSRFVPAAHLVVHASYDRIFQVPAIENLLLASSPQFDSASSFVLRLPVQPALAHYFEVGFAQELANKVRITGNIFVRSYRNFADDDVLLNTGISFPISDRSALIHGEEVSVFLPEWRHLLMQVSYTNQNGTASGPITGGLFLGDEGAQELSNTGRFTVSQDQRNTVRARLRWSPHRLFWMGAHAQYNSGLPVELNDDVDIDQLRAQYGASVVDAINFNRGRVRPWSSVDLSAGTELYHAGDRELALEVHTTNIADRVNVINFASLFSGTAIAPPRTVNARLRFSF